MTSETSKTSRRMRWFLPDTPDVLGMLRAQAQVTVEGMDALDRWARGDQDAAQSIREIEHRADHRKRDLRLALRDAFTTPIDAEDLYVLSSLLDGVMNAVKDAVRESEVMSIGPDEHVLRMAEHLGTGVRNLADAFDMLRGGGKSGSEPTESADAAIKAQRQVERVYRSAMSSLLNVDDLREVIGRRELYRRFSRVSDVIVACAERVWYALVKEA